MESLINCINHILLSFLLFSCIAYCGCVRFVGMVRRNRHRVENESDEDVPVTDYSDDSDYDESQPSDTAADPISRYCC